MGLMAGFAGRFGNERILHEEIECNGNKYNFALHRYALWLAYAGLSKRVE